MLVLALRSGFPEDEVILRDADGNKLCEVMVSKIDRNKVRLVFTAPHQVKINRRSIDEEIDWEDKRNRPRCAICKDPLSPVQADSTGLAHAVCAAHEKRN